jgi:hypothetical protein
VTVRVHPCRREEVKIVLLEPRREQLVRNGDLECLTAERQGDKGANPAIELVLVESLTKRANCPIPKIFELGARRSDQERPRQLPTALSTPVDSPQDTGSDLAVSLPSTAQRSAVRGLHVAPQQSFRDVRRRAVCSVSSGALQELRFTIF